MRFFLAALLLWHPQEGAVVSGKILATEGEVQKKLRAKVKYAGPGIEEHRDADSSPPVVWLEGAPAGKTEPRTVDLRQAGLEFRPRVVALPVGSTVNFPNDDNIQHNVFSFSKARRFDLGRYSKGKSKSETFETRGRIDVRCEVHDHMRAFIHIFDHPYFAVAGADGSYALPKVPPGKYVLWAWKEFFDPVKQGIEVGAGGAKVDVTLVRGDDRPAERTAGGACCGAR